MWWCPSKFTLLNAKTSIDRILFNLNPKRFEYIYGYLYKHTLWLGMGFGNNTSTWQNNSNPPTSTFWTDCPKTKVKKVDNRPTQDDVKPHPHASNARHPTPTTLHLLLIHTTMGLACKYYIPTLQCIQEYTNKYTNY